MSTVTFKTTLARAELALNPRIYWLVVIQHAQRAWFFSEMAYPLVTPEGVRRVEGGLRRLEIVEEARFFQAEAADQSASLELDLPEELWQRLMRRDLANCTCEISQLIEGAAYTARALRLVGRIEVPALGATRETTSLTVTANVWATTEQIPDERQRVDGTTWSTVTSLTEQEVGLSYPIVIGRPGLLNDGRIAGSQGVWVDHTNVDDAGNRLQLRLVIAGHRVAARRVYLCTDENNGAAQRFEVQHGLDARGQTVAYVDAQVSDGTYRLNPDLLVGDGNPTHGLGDSAGVDNSPPTNGEYVPWYVCWDDESQPSRGGGLTHGEQALQTAVGALAWLMRQSGLPVDLSAFQTAEALLRRFTIGMVIDARCRPWDVARERLLPLLPIALQLGPLGVRPILWRGSALREEVQIRLDVQAHPMITRASKLISEDRDIKNRWIFHWAYSVRTGQYTETSYTGVGPFVAGDPTSLPHPACVLSQQRYRRADGSPREEIEELSSVALYDKSVARMVIHWRVDAFALARQQVEYELPSGFNWLELGDAVLLSDVEIGLEERVGVIDRLARRSGGGLRVRVTLWEIPRRDIRVSA